MSGFQGLLEHPENGNTTLPPASAEKEEEAVYYGPENRPADWISKPPTPQRKRSVDSEKMTDVETPVRKPPPKRTPSSNRFPPPDVLLPPARQEIDVVPLDPNDEMFWRSSWQERNQGNIDVSGVLAYSAIDVRPKAEPPPLPPIPLTPKCPYHPDCDGKCQ
ncbi:unnamed protein product, partial [Mesorhabditis spiculigera]